MKGGANVRKMRKLIALIFLCFLIVSLNTMAAVKANSIVTTTTNGWLTDLDGNLLKDSEGYYVLTLKPESVSGGKVTANLNEFASIFLNDFRNISSARYTKKVKILNKTGKTLVYKDYTFTTENDLPRTENIFSVTQGKLTNSMNRAFGSAYTAMLSTITSRTYRTDLSLDVKGFDGKNINIMIANLRCVNDAIIDFYNVDDSFDITLPQMMNLDENLRRAGYSSYSDYLMKYYNVSSLDQLQPEIIYNILGTTNGAQSAVTNWRDNTIDGKPVPASEVGQLTNQFKIWGILDLNMDESDKDIYPYVPNYFMMETDPEVIRFAYDYLYSNGLRFTFDFDRYPYDTTDSEIGQGGMMGVKAYVEKEPDSDSIVKDIIGTTKVKNGESIKLDHVSAGLYVPNSWNQYRLYDFGFSLIFTVDKNGTVPKTGDDTNLVLLGSMFTGSLIAAGWLIFVIVKKKKNEKSSEKIT